MMMMMMMMMVVVVVVQICSLGGVWLMNLAVVVYVCDGLMMQAEAEERRERQERQEMLEKKRQKEELLRQKEEAVKVGNSIFIYALFLQSTINSSTSQPFLWLTRFPYFCTEKLEHFTT